MQIWRGNKSVCNALFTWKLIDIDENKNKFLKSLQKKSLQVEKQKVKEFLLFFGAEGCMMKHI